MPSVSPAMVQWQQRFDAAQATAQAPKRPDESVQTYQMRTRAAYEQLRQLQTAKPTPTAPPPKAKPKGAPRASGGFSGILSSVSNAMQGSKPK